MTTPEQGTELSAHWVGSQLYSSPLQSPSIVQRSSRVLALLSSHAAPAVLYSTSQVLPLGVALTTQGPESHVKVAPVHTPWSSQRSFLVFSFPSSQGTPGVMSKEQPEFPLQKSSVHGFPSSHGVSSMAPLQLSSSPLQTSSEGSGASQSWSPSGAH